MVEACAGDTITVNPGEVHDGAPIGDAGRSWRILYFDPSLIAQATGDMSEGKNAICEFTHPVIRDAGISRRFQKLFCVVTRGRAAATALEREEHLLLLLPAVLGDRKASAESILPKTIFTAKSLLDDDPTAPIMLSDLARVSGLSRFQVLRGFVKATGLTPHAYLVQRRINITRRLIARGTPLAEAAVAGGFADQSHMTRIFVRTYGVSPRAYADAMT
jgi:AraC-like DNA-binding protein